MNTDCIKLPMAVLVTPKEVSDLREKFELAKLRRDNEEARRLLEAERFWLDVEARREAGAST